MRKHRRQYSAFLMDMEVRSRSFIYLLSLSVEFVNLCMGSKNFSTPCALNGHGELGEPLDYRATLSYVEYDSFCVD